jgi:hypothetical protein
VNFTGRTPPVYQAILFLEQRRIAGLAVVLRLRLYPPCQAPVQRFRQQDSAHDRHAVMQRNDVLVFVNGG